MKTIPNPKDKEALKALQWNDVARVRKLVEGGLKIDRQIRKTQWEIPATLLAKACERSRVGIAHYLIRAGANLDAGRFYPPLIAAAERGSVRLAKLLLNAGANPNVPARFNGDPDSDTDSDSNWTPLMSAAVRNEVQMLELLLTHGANPGLQTRMGRSPLSLAVLHGHHAIARKLINASRGKIKATPLLAAVRDDITMLRLLVKAGANVNAAYRTELYKRQCTPLEEAVSRTVRISRRGAKANRPNVGFIKALLKEGANLNQPTRWKSPLYFAAAAGDAELIQILLKQGAKPNLAISCVGSERGRTSLHAAAAEGFVEVAKLLLAAGADARKRDSEGHTPLDIVRAQEKSSEIHVAEMTTHQGTSSPEALDAMYADWSKRRAEVIRILESAELTRSGTPSREFQKR